MNIWRMVHPWLRDLEVHDRSKLGAMVKYSRIKLVTTFRV